VFITGPFSRMKIPLPPPLFIALAFSFSQTKPKVNLPFAQNLRFSLLVFLFLHHTKLSTSGHIRGRPEGYLPPLAACGRILCFTETPLVLSWRRVCSESSSRNFPPERLQPRSWSLFRWLSLEWSPLTWPDPVWCFVWLVVFPLKKLSPWITA